ncbi:hypothetical protein CEV34_5147 [Brucella pseudogrignonensis]|uniref:Uncharacterized protein n=1 Tax=Brucella pseudogrignonensis TaxID=419475 RepID=A0A256G2V7_9HYPH|nr:hypothetical protein CEV34_5147 [Brucella pseudogrignonensis]
MRGSRHFCQRCRRPDNRAGQLCRWLRHDTVDAGTRRATRQSGAGKGNC